MVGLKLLGILMLTLMVTCLYDPTQSSISPQVQLYQENRVLCRSVCNSIDANSSTFSSEYQMAKDLIWVAGNSYSAIDIALAMNDYGAEFKQKHFDTWLGFESLQQYKDKLIKTFRKKFPDIIKQVGSNGNDCKLCPEYDPNNNNLLSQALSFVKPARDLLSKEKMGATLEQEILTKPLVDLPINRFPKFKDINARLLQIRNADVRLEQVEWQECYEFFTGRVFQDQCFELRMDYIENELGEIIGVRPRPTMLVNPGDPDYPNNNNGDGNNGDDDDDRTRINLAVANGAATLLSYSKFGPDLLKLKNACKVPDSQYTYDETC